MTSKVLLIKKTKKTKKIRIFKRTYLRHLHKPKFFDHNNIKLLFHNFYGFYLLDGLFKSNKYNFVNLSGNVVKFEYKYKFDTVNLRAVKPRLNELYIYIDVGLKNILQFNSKEFYLNPSSIVETSDRVSVTLFEIEKAFFDSPFQSFPWNVHFFNKYLTETILDKSKSKLINQDQYNLNVFKPYYFYETVLTYRPYLAEYFLKNHFFKKAQIKGLFLKPKLLKRLAFYNTFESDDHKEWFMFLNAWRIIWGRRRLLNSKLLRKCVSNFYVAYESPIFFKSGFKKQRKFKNVIFKRFIKLIKQKRFTLIRPIFKNKKFHGKQRYFVKKQLRHNLNFIPGKFDKRHTGMKSKSNDSFHYFKYGKSYAKKQFYLNEWKYSKKKKPSRLWVLIKKRRFLIKKIKKIYTKLTRPFNRRKKYSVRLAKKMPWKRNILMLEKAITISVFRPFETKAFMMNLLILDPAQNFNFNLAARTNYKFWKYYRKLILLTVKQTHLLLYLKEQSIKYEGKKKNKPNSLKRGRKLLKTLFFSKLSIDLLKHLTTNVLIFLHRKTRLLKKLAKNDFDLNLLADVFAVLKISYDTFLENHLTIFSKNEYLNFSLSKLTGYLNLACNDLSTNTVLTNKSNLSINPTVGLNVVLLHEFTKKFLTTICNTLFITGFFNKIFFYNLVLLPFFRSQNIFHFHKYIFLNNMENCINNLVGNLRKDLIPKSFTKKLVISPLWFFKKSRKKFDPSNERLVSFAFKRSKKKYKYGPVYLSKADFLQKSKNRNVKQLLGYWQFNKRWKRRVPCFFLIRKNVWCGLAAACLTSMRIYKPYMRFQKTNRFLYLKRVMRRARLKRLTAKDKQYLKNPKLQQAVDNVKRLLRKRPNSLFSQKHRLFYKYKINNYKFMLRNRPIFSVVNFINHKFKLRFDLRFKHRMFKWKYPSKYKSRNFFKVKHKLKYLYRVKKILRFTGFLLNKWKRKKKSLFYRRKKRRRKYFVIYKERHLYKKWKYKKRTGVYLKKKRLLAKKMVKLHLYKELRKALCTKRQKAQRWIFKTRWRALNAFLVRSAFASIKRALFTNLKLTKKAKKPFLLIKNLSKKKKLKLLHSFKMRRSLIKKKYFLVNFRSILWGEVEKQNQRIYNVIAARTSEGEKNIKVPALFKNKKSKSKSNKKKLKLNVAKKKR